MTTYEKNLETLAKHYPGMDVLIGEAKEKLEPILEVVEENSDEGETILKVNKDNGTYYLNGKRNTMEPARMWVETLGDLPRNAPVLFMGVGNPSYLKELTDKMEKRLTIIVYEPSLQIFLKVLELVDFESIMEKHLLIFWIDGLKDMDRKHMERMLEGVLAYEKLGYLRHLVLPNYDVMFYEESVEFMKMCRDIALRELVQYNTRNNFSSVMVKNLLSNARYLPDGYKTTQLPDVIPSDIPGILVAAGPSLNKNVQELKKAKGKAFIIAVDTAMKPLLQAGIIPDMFAIIDAKKPLELVQMEEAKKIPLVTTLGAASEVLQYHEGMKIFYNEGYQFAERIFFRTGQRIGDVSSGGSVATNVFSLLYKIGINTIILVGQDLAYTNNKSHADGTFHEVMEEVDTSRFIMVEGNNGEEVPTRTDFKLFLDWYNNYIEGCQEHREGFRVINATEGGAKIKNTEIMTLRDAIDRECTKEIDIQECLRKLPPMLNEEGRKWAIEYLQDMPNAFHKLKIDAGRTKKLYEKLDIISKKKNIDRKEYLSILKKLEKAIKKIEPTSVYQLVKITMDKAQYILGSEQFLQQDTLQEEAQEIARKGILYMKNVVEMASMFEEYSRNVL